MLSEIQKYLSGHPWSDKIQYFDTIDSTNTCAKQLAVNGAPEGTVILAGHQTGGKGRMGRSFSSPEGMGIYMSVILRPACFPEELMHLTCAAAVAASFSIEATTSMQPGIKWTNDLVLGERKLGGILTELSVNPSTRIVDWAIVGIGINCRQTAADFPAEIRDIAVSLGLQGDALPKLSAALIAQMHSVRLGLFSNKADLMDAYRHRCMTVGKEISILRGDSVFHATAISIDNDGGLQVRYPDGTVATVTSGEVSIRGMYGYV